MSTPAVLAGRVAMKRFGRLPLVVVRMVAGETVSSYSETVRVGWFKVGLARPWGWRRGGKRCGKRVLVVLVLVLVVLVVF